jgi:hypothetical protein
MKLIFLIFKSRYRYKDIGNFLYSKIYNNFFLINLSGPLKSILGRFLIALKIGRAISLDGNPIIKHKSDGINTMKYELLSIDTIYNKHKLINVKA